MTECLSKGDGLNPFHGLRLSEGEEISPLPGRCGGPRVDRGAGIPLFCELVLAGGRMIPPLRL